MNNTFKKIFLFIIYFSLFMAVTLPTYYYINSTDFKRISRSFDPEQVRTTCPKSPEVETYQDCFRPFIVKLIEVASPLEILKLPHILNDLRDRDHYQGIFSSDQIESQYIGAWAVFIRNISSYELKRKNIDFFQILILPIVRKLLQNKIIELKVQVQNFVDKNPNFLDVEINKKNFNLIQTTRVEIL